MARKQVKAFTPKRRSFLGTLPEIRVRIYECILSSTVLVFANSKPKSKKPKSKRDTKEWNERRKETSVYRRLPLLLVCKQVYSELGPALLSTITFKFDGWWGAGFRFSQPLTALLSTPFDIRRIVLHHGLARHLFAELQDGGLSALSEVTLLGQGRITSASKNKHGVWCLSISDGWGGYELSFEALNNMAPLPFDMMVQFAPYDLEEFLGSATIPKDEASRRQIYLGRFSTGSMGEVDFNLVTKPPQQAVWPVEEIQ